MYYSDPRVLDGTLVAVVESGDLGNLAEFDRFVGLEMEEWRVALGAAAHTLDPGDVGADGWFARPS